MTIQFTNNSATTLASGITNVATSLTVASGTGVLFPTPSGALFFYATLQSATNSAIREIVKVTASTTDTFTIVRGQDGTTGTAFSTGDKVELRVTAADLNNFGQLDTANTWASGQVFVAPVLGTPASGLLTNCTGYTYANLTGTVPTWNQNTTGTAASLSAVLSASLGGTGEAGTLTGVLYGNGTGAYTVATTAQMLAGVGTVPIAQGGTGASSLTANNVLLGNGTSAVQVVAPGTSGNILTSNGTTWTSTAPAGGNPAGTIIFYAGTTAPTGYLICPTSLTNVSRTTYAALFAAIGTTWGAGDGSTTFGLPWFAADYTAIQANSNVGTASVGQVIAHTHTIFSNQGVATSISPTAVGSSGTGNSTGSTGGSANLAAGTRVLHCIKF